MPRIRELGIFESKLPTGQHNAITDVGGVAVGHCTILEDAQSTGVGPYRTGVTMILPHTDNLYEDKVAGAVYAINAFGKYIGTEQVRETGSIETPIALTSTLNGPRVADAVMSVMIEQNPHISRGFPETGYAGYNSVNALVGECNDGFLNEAQSRRVNLPEVRAALANASTGPVEEGSVGGGTGMSCFGWKGGIGTASRVIPERKGGFTVGALVQTNFGKPHELTICGVPVGQKLQPPDPPTSSLPELVRSTLVEGPDETGSIMIVLATDAPLDGRQLERLCRRVPFGLGRTGSNCHTGSGDFVIAFSTTYRIPDRPQSILMQRTTVANEQYVLSVLGQAVIECVEEAIYNSMLVSPTMIGRNDHVRHGLPADEVARLVRANRKTDC